MGRRRTRRKKQRGGAPSASPAFKHYIPEPAFPPGGSYKVGCPTRKNGYYYQYNCTGGTCPAKSTVGELSPGFGNWIANRAKTVQGQGQQDKNKSPVRRPQRGGRRRRTKKRCYKCPSRCCKCCKCRNPLGRKCRCRKCPSKCCPCCRCKRKHSRKRRAGRRRRRHTKRRTKRRRRRTRRRQRGGSGGIMNKLVGQLFTTTRELVPPQVKDSLRGGYEDWKNLRYKYLGAETRLTADPMSQPISDLKLSEDDFPDKAKPKGKEDKEKVLNVEGEKVSVKK